MTGNLRASLLLLIFLSTLTESWSSRSFTGAVYEHARKGSGSTADIQSNLKYYERATRLAKKQGADLIVFPEYGIFPPTDRRADVKKLLELIPDPRTDTVNPCNKNDFHHRPILSTLSCMAKKSRIIVVANMGGIEPCSGQPTCNEDGDRHLNANVAFDRNGTLVGRYYKERLFFEDCMDLPAGKQDPTFQTDIGKFAMFICFDIIFQKITDVAQLNDVEAVLFSTWWHNSSPFYISTQWFQAWAMGNNVTFLAANVQIPGYLGAGSGIYRGRQGALASTLRPDGVSKLIVATISDDPAPSKIIEVTENDARLVLDDSSNLPYTCAYGILGKSKDVGREYRCANENLSNYTIVALSKPSDHLELCQDDFCCQLDYSLPYLNESFYFGVRKGLYNALNRYFWSEENCFVARCDDFNGTKCGNFPMKSWTSFNKVVLKANFTSKHIYPSLVGNDVQLVPLSEWRYGIQRNMPTLEFHGSGYGIPLLMATLKGRAYDKDPPYIR